MSFETQRRFLYQTKPERKVEKSEPFSAKKISPLRTIKKLYAHSHPLAKIIMAMHLHQKRSNTVPLQSVSQRNIPTLLKSQNFPKLPKSTKCEVYQIVKIIKN